MELHRFSCAGLPCPPFLAKARVSQVQEDSTESEEMSDFGDTDEGGEMEADNLDIPKSHLSHQSSNQQKSKVRARACLGSRVECDIEQRE